MSDAAARERALADAEKFRQTDPMFLGWRERSVVVLADALAAEQERTRQLEARVRMLERAKVLNRDRTRQLEGLLRKARGYVEEPGPPGTVIETTEESAERAEALLADIDAALDSEER